MDFHELKGMTVAQLRDVAKGIEGLHGYRLMHKDQLLLKICEHLHIDPHEHHEVVGVDKAAIKARIRDLKRARRAALEAHDKDELAHVRHEIHKLKHTLRRATV